MVVWRLSKCAGKVCPDTFETVSGLKRRMIQFYEANNDTCIVK